ncbi:MAG: flippase-like domain-containing protein [Gemmatimonadetes bacterium]|nr:flippase-like domain-containing protein [Gemmatimonadota bacterium]
MIEHVAPVLACSGVLRRLVPLGLRGSASRRRSAWPLSWLMASALLFLCLRGIDWQRAWVDPGAIRAQWVALAIAFNVGILLLWAAAWRVFLPAAERVAFPRMFEIAALTAMTINTLPFLAGHASGVVLLARRGKVSGGAALSVMATHTFAEGLAKVAILLVAALVIPLPAWMTRAWLLVTLGVAALAAVLLSLARAGSSFRATAGVGGVPGQSPGAGKRHPKFRAVSAAVFRWAWHLEALRSGRRFALGMMLLLAMKAAEATAILCVQRAFGVDLPSTTAPVVLAAVLVATMIPVAPANMGAYEAGVFLVYQQLGLTPEQALSLALVQHVCLLAALVGTGYLIVLVHYARGRRRAAGTGLALLAAHRASGSR